jgi:hypothetical protein
MKFLTAWPAWTSRAWIVAPCVTAIAALPVWGAVAQDQPPQDQSQQQYETPLYTTQPPTALDPNYGLPNFGMPGSELPQQRTMGTPAKADPTAKGGSADAADKADTAGGTGSGTQDFFAGSTEITLPRPRTSPSDSDTPLYTTSQGSTTGETNSTTGETPLYDDGSTTSDPAARR